MLSRGNRSVSAQDQDDSDSEAAQRDLVVDQNGSDDESFVGDEDGSDNASEHELKPPRRRRRATPPAVPPPAGSMDLGAQNARHCVRRLQI